MNNYRVVVEQGICTIRDCYYNEQEKPVSISDIALYPVGDSFQELRKDLKDMLNALDKPVLLATDFQNEN